MDIDGEHIAGLRLLDGLQLGRDEARHADLPSDNVNISDVLEAVVQADPANGLVAAGRGGGAVEMAARPPAPQATVQIVEQPAPKALRFRYECEGRSAGSIPGVNSTSENRTYPTIRINGFVGQATIVVSCVTKEMPHRPHPHNLVGREGCQRGVFTFKPTITAEANEYQFRNLGIQCVKRRDIADALQQRAALRVDPFRTGFDHRNNPQGIDLNAVRLAFQVFLHEEGGSGRLYSLPPVVSDVIYDKKAMCDLLIMRASHCSGPVAGGTQVILLCEKVTRDDTAVVFYQEDASGRVIWEQVANTVLVHKQVAIVFETPAYTAPHYNARTHRGQIHVKFQLKRNQENQRSNPLDFEYIPEFQGTVKPLPNLAALARLLADTDPNNNTGKESPLVSSTTDTNDTTLDISEDSGSALIADVNGNPQIEIDDDVDMRDTNETSLNDLLEQVAELDEIYSENRTRRETAPEPPPRQDSDDFDDAGTYTSLQLAFKNPLEIAEPEPAPYEDVHVQTYRGPIIEFSPLKRDPDEDRAPPLPPKRVRRPGSAAGTESFKTSQTSVNSVLKPGRPLPLTRDPAALAPPAPLTAARSEPALPPVKKRSFFSRLFRRKDKSPAPSVKSEGKRETKVKPVGRSVSSVSGVRPSKFKSSVSHTSLKDNASGAGLSYADSITHISLHGDDNEKSASQTSLRRDLGPAPPTGTGTILVAESVLALDADAFKKLQDELELTDAEHYALYMAVAPRATVSEFDETSCYYSPVDGSKFQNSN